jgi:hypothetical protein
MNQKLQQIYDSVPEDQPRSRLEPYRELILRWRRQGRTYRRIQELLKDKCDLQISYLALYEFVQSRSRPRKAQPEPEIEQPTVAPAEPRRNQMTTVASGTDPYAEARERMRKHKQEAAVPLKAERRFEYTDQDSIDPIVLLPKTEKEK